VKRQRFESFNIGIPHATVNDPPIEGEKEGERQGERERERERERKRERKRETEREREAEREREGGREGGERGRASERASERERESARERCSCIWSYLASERADTTSLLPNTSAVLLWMRSSCSSTASDCVCVRVCVFV